MKTKSLKKQNYVLLAIITAIILLCIGFASSPVIAFAYTPETAVEENLSTFAETQQQNAEPDTVGSIAHNKGLGRGINVLTATEYDTFTPSYILDAEKLETMYANKITKMKGDEYFDSSYKFDDIELGNTFFAEIATNVDFTFINAGAGSLVSGSFKLKSYRHKYYNVYHYDYKNYALSINDYDNKAIYADNFSELFLNDLENVSNGSMTEEALFARYGTHIVGSALYGGQLSSLFFVASNTIKIDQNLENGLTEYIDVFNSKTLTDTSVVSNINNILGTSFSKSSVKCGGKIFTKGGASIPSGSNLDWCNGDGLKDWRNGINNNDSANVIIGYEEGGLVPIWNILPEKYDNVAQKLRNTFTREYSSCYNKFVSDVHADNTTDYAGGDGSFAYPYQIKTVNHLMNVARNMDANFILADDLDLSSIQWEPLGGFYCNKQFTGVFDGNNKTIKNLTRTSDIEERNNRIFFGLFCEIANGGLVKNLKFSGVNIKMTGPSVNNASTIVYVGTLAASVRSASIKNCQVNSGTCSYDICTNGEAITGGICGRASDADISDCTNKAKVVSGRYGGIAGGICGYGRKTDFYNCKNTASVTSKCTAWWGTSVAGGIVGMAYNESVLTDYCDGGSASIQAKDYGNGISWTAKAERIIGYKTNWER